MDNTVDFQRCFASLFLDSCREGALLRAGRWLRRASITTGIKLAKQGIYVSRKFIQRKSTGSYCGKKPYEKPSFRFEKVFVTSALSCGKTGTQAQCSLVLKAS